MALLLSALAEVAVNHEFSAEGFFLGSITSVDVIGDWWAAIKWSSKWDELGPGLRLLVPCLYYVAFIGTLYDFIFGWIRFDRTRNNYPVPDLVYKCLYWLNPVGACFCQNCRWSGSTVDFSDRPIMNCMLPEDYRGEECWGLRGIGILFWQFQWGNIVSEDILGFLLLSIIESMTDGGFSAASAFSMVGNCLGIVAKICKAQGLMCSNRTASAAQGAAQGAAAAVGAHDKNQA
eukprot:TRINITY_DN98189_c0_g1_i1.p1 TRINITY_DN98189_c0_g1~~TRINITY_DN98189_c0_g1_i1.p1  ORF type:complete len:233 (+),score=21.49 TRINITY_DN98189_c0_g1_i1:69-767(+)